MAVTVRNWSGMAWVSEDAGAHAHSSQGKSPAPSADTCFNNLKTKGDIFTRNLSKFILKKLHKRLS